MIDNEASAFSGCNTDSALTARAVLLYPTDLMNNTWQQAAGTAALLAPI
jgi:hypothetical protein